jgi:hypothetical protein
MEEGDGIRDGPRFFHRKRPRRGDFSGILNLARPRLHPWLDFVFFHPHPPSANEALSTWAGRREPGRYLEKVHCALVWLFHQPRTERDWGIPHDHLGAYHAYRLSP